MKELIKNKKFLAIFAAALVLIIALIFFFTGRSRVEGLEPQEQLTNIEAIPTVDSSVIVDLKVGKRSGEVILTIQNAPEGTRSIEYQLTYDAVSREQGGSVVPRGVIGKCVKQSGSQNTWSCEQPNSGEAIVLGTCSSGTCVYDNITGDINVQLKFTGSYGDKIFEKDFNL
ncbi:hypothetical protein A3F29_04135 [Candidatus Roizmanbacteria bacterium RIFCSPHIGHO2_12_FULL_33_9]|uniref:Uncharacterized protein n=1 Tax=Candidatus Roizmanbacteria bacterium RIFCSPHIGHO2_12_FULL_33_9 TaxID=1802045 RepID=A0A1F7HKK1_9BACT|nr:MAG: hypothetical protein A3F29_04135 [Candidatus Roizmanbacteria bacterium RIFCSPHIGHO2_12_FULL_33_9]